MKIKNHTLIKIHKSDIVNGTCVIPEEVTRIGPYCFYGQNITHIRIPGHVTHIMAHAFDLCWDLTNVVLSDGIIYIDEFAFGNCGNLTTVTIPDSVQHIGKYCFAGCRKLNTAVLPHGLTIISDFLFCGCGFQSLTLPDSVASIGRYAFDDCWDLARIFWRETVYPVKCVDGYCLHILHTKPCDDCVIHKCEWFSELGKPIYAAEKGGTAAHGASVKEAVREMTFKLLVNRDPSEHAARILEQGYVTPMDYRVIAKAFKIESERFLEKHNLTWDSKGTIQDTLKLMKGEYGYETFLKTLCNNGYKL